MVIKYDRHRVVESGSSLSVLRHLVPVSSVARHVVRIEVKPYDLISTRLTRDFLVLRKADAVGDFAYFPTPCPTHDLTSRHVTNMR